MLTKIITNTTLAAIALSMLSGNVQAASVKNTPIAVSHAIDLESCRYPVFWSIFRGGCHDTDPKLKRKIPKINGGEGGTSHDRGGKQGHGGDSPTGKQ